MLQEKRISSPSIAVTFILWVESNKLSRRSRFFRFTIRDEKKLAWLCHLKFGPVVYIGVRRHLKLNDYQFMINFICIDISRFMKWISLCKKTNFANVKFPNIGDRRICSKHFSRGNYNNPQDVITSSLRSLMLVNLLYSSLLQWCAISVNMIISQEAPIYSLFTCRPMSLR